MKRHEVRLTCDCQFSHGVVAAGTLVGVIMMRDEKIDPISLLGMIQFNQASIVETELKDIYEPDETVSEESSAFVEESEGTVETVESEDSFDDDQEDAPESDLAGILDESLIELLKLNGIETKAQLLEFLASGKDLVDLDKIGTTRAKRILAAVEGLK